MSFANGLRPEFRFPNELLLQMNCKLSNIVQRNKQLGTQADNRTVN